MCGVLAVADLSRSHLDDPVCRVAVSAAEAAVRCAWRSAGSIPPVLDEPGFLCFRALG